MDSRKDQAALGLIILLIGVFIFMNGFFEFDFGNLSLIAAGFAFLLLFRTKRKSWSLLMGGYLLYFGVSSAFIDSTTGAAVTERMFTFVTSSLLLLVTGVIMLILFYEKNKRGLLLPGALLIAISVNTFLSTVLLISEEYVFYFVFAVFAYFVHRQGRYFLGPWLGLMAVIFAFIGFVRLFLHIF
jgi:hypothetical protein